MSFLFFFFEFLFFCFMPLSSNVLLCMTSISTQQVPRQSSEYKIIQYIYIYIINKTKQNEPVVYLCVLVSICVRLYRSVSRPQQRLCKFYTTRQKFDGIFLFATIPNGYQLHDFYTTYLIVLVQQNLSFTLFDKIFLNNFDQ